MLRPRVCMRAQASVCGVQGLTFELVSWRAVARALFSVSLCVCVRVPAPTQREPSKLNRRAESATEVEGDHHWQNDAGCLRFLCCCWLALDEASLRRRARPAHPLIFLLSRDCLPPFSIRGMRSAKTNTHTYTDTPEKRKQQQHRRAATTRATSTSTLRKRRRKRRAMATLTHARERT